MRGFRPPSDSLICEARLGKEPADGRAVCAVVVVGPGAMSDTACVAPAL